jgi:hypothetical protein
MQKNIKTPITLISFFILFLVFIGLFTNDIVYGEELRDYPKIGQWKPQKNVQIFLEDNLFDYINGASELYLSYQFQQLDVVYYQNRKKQEITLEIYTHASPLFAFGIYSQERSSDGKYLDIGSESYLEGDYLFVLAGKYYLKIHSYDLDTDAESVLTEITRSIIELLNCEKTLPAQISVFPKENLRPKSIQFIAENLLGYGFFKEGFQAFYNFGDESCRLFMIESSSIRETNELFDQYIFHIHHAPRIPGSIEYKVEDPYHGIGIIRKCERYVYGGFGLLDMEQLAKLLNRLQENICR